MSDFVRCDGEFLRYRVPITSIDGRPLDPELPVHVLLRCSLGPLHSDGEGHPVRALRVVDWSGPWTVDAGPVIDLGPGEQLDRDPAVIERRLWQRLGRVSAQLDDRGAGDGGLAHEARELIEAIQRLRALMPVAVEPPAPVDAALLWKACDNAGCSTQLADEIIEEYKTLTLNVGHHPV